MATPPEPDTVDAQLHELRKLFYAAIFGLIVMSVGVNIYLGKQMRLAQAQLAEQRQTLDRMADDFHRGTEPLIRNFTAALQSFAETNRDFEPILAKYRPGLSNYFGGPVTPQPQPIPRTNP